MPGDLKDWILHLGLSPLMVVGAMMVIYILLGTIMEELSMVLLTIPVFFPIVVQLGFEDGPWVEIRGALEPDDLIVTQGAAALAHEGEV